jgi:hypothetical protein
MATKRKTTTKKDLEAKIAELEAKLAKISSQAGGTAKASPPPPKPAEAKPAEAKPAEAPKPAQQKAAPPATLAQALENAWQNYPVGNNTHYYKEHTTGFSPNTNRYYGRLIAPVGKAPTQDWNLQKAKVTGFTQPSNQYFATRARLAYHPADKDHIGYGLVVEGAAAQAKQAPPPPPPPQPKAEPQQQQTASTDSSKQSSLEAYEAEYLARLEREDKENAELMRAAQELAAKRKTESGGSSGQASSTKGSLPKGF